MKTNRVAVIVAAIAFGITLVGCDVPSAEKADLTAKDTATVVTPSPTARPTTPAVEKLSDGTWVLQSVSLQKEGFTGHFKGSMRLTNTSDEARSGIFTLTVFKSGKQVAILEGTVSGTQAGDTGTVMLISTDTFVPGPWTYDFQVSVDF